MGCKPLRLGVSKASIVLLAAFIAGKINMDRKLNFDKNMDYSKNSQTKNSLHRRNADILVSTDKKYSLKHGLLQIFCLALGSDCKAVINAMLIHTTSFQAISSTHKQLGLMGLQPIFDC